MMDDEDMYLPYHFMDMHTKLTRDFDNGDKLSLTYYLSRDKFTLENNEDPDTIDWHWGNNTVSANFTHLFTPKHFGHFTAAYSQFSHGLSFGTGDFMEDGVQDFTLRALLSTAYPKHTVELGAEMKYLYVKNRIEDPDYGTPLWDWSAGSAIISLYGQDEWRPSPLWTLEAGLRNELSTLGTYYRLSPRLSAMRVLDERTRLKLSLGQYYQFFQAVPKFDLIGMDFFDTWTLAQPGLEPIWATHVILRGETEHLWDLPLSLDIYYKRMGNLWQHRDFYSPNNYFPDMFEIGEGWAAGADLMARFTWHGWAGWMAYSYSYVVNTFPLINSGEPFYPKQDRRFDMSLNVARDIGRNFTLGCAFMFNSGKPYTEPIGFYPMPCDPEVPSVWTYEPYYGGYNNKRVPLYHRLDVSISNRGEYSWGDIEWFAQVLNIYGRKNINSLFYEVSSEDEDSPPIVDQDTIPELSFPMPSVGIRIWF